MNEDYSEAEPVETIAAYKDRSGGLKVFGVLTILLGCLCGLFVPLIFVGQYAAAAQGRGGPQPNPWMGAAIYGVMAVVLVWMGIGSVMARRWARALLLIFSWGGLLVGIVSVFMMTLLMPKILAGMSVAGANGRQPLPPGTMTGIVVGMIGFIGFFFVLLPAVWVFFYGSRNVKATVEAHDPVIRWTDACPLPVLAASIWLMFSVLALLIMPFTGHCVLPFFGIFLTGAPAIALSLAYLGVFICAAWLLYRLREMGWWLTVIGYCVMMASSLVTFSRSDIAVMYRLMGYSQGQLDQLQATGMLGAFHNPWIWVGAMAPFVAYLLFIKRYFRKRG